LQANPTRNIVIEGHTAHRTLINLALGERRPPSVRNYLVSRGFPAVAPRNAELWRKKPRFDNSREETRRLQPAAALVV